MHSWWENSSAPTGLRLVYPDTLNVDVALYGYGAYSVELVDGLAEITQA